MEISTKQLLQQVDHLLSGVESSDETLTQEVADLRTEVANAIYLCTIQQEVIARAHLDGVISPRVDALIMELGSRKTEPGLIDKE